MTLKANSGSLEDFDHVRYGLGRVKTVLKEVSSESHVFAALQQHR
jgi:hypothetical protein